MHFVLGYYQRHSPEQKGQRPLRWIQAGPEKQKEGGIFFRGSTVERLPHQFARSPP